MQSCFGVSSNFQSSESSHITLLSCVSCGTVLHHSSNFVIDCRPVFTKSKTCNLCTDFLYKLISYLQQGFQSSNCRQHTCDSYAPGPRASTGLPRTAPGRPQVTAAPTSLLPSPFPHAARRAALPPHSHPDACQLRYAAAPFSHGHSLILTQNTLSQSFGIV